MLDEVKVRCPYCGERFSAIVDASGGTQSYVEDCPVCCRPIEIAVDVDADGSLGDIRAGTDQD